MNQSLSDNPLFKFFNRLGEYFLLSFYWLLCSLPVLTLGTATIALYDTVTHCIRNGEGAISRRFFGTFRKELLRGLLLTVLGIFVAVSLGAGYSMMYQLGQSSKLWGILSLIYLITLFFPAATFCWAVAMESRFVYSFGQLLKNAFTFTICYLPYTAAIVAALLAGAFAVLCIPVAIIGIPAAIGHLQSVFIEKVFAKYIPEES